MDLPEHNGKDYLGRNKETSSMVNDVSYPPELLRWLREIFPDFHWAHFRADGKSGEGYLSGDVDTSYYRHHKKTDVDYDTRSREVVSQEGILDLNCNPAAKGFEEAIENGNLRIIALSTLGQVAKVQKLEEFIKHVCTYINAYMTDGFYYLVVFPESFFNFLMGDPRIPLNSNQVDLIISQLNNELNKPNVMLSLCFLEEVDAACAKSRPWLSKWNLPPEHKELETVEKSCLEYYGYDDLTAHRQGRQVANYNVFYWRGMALAFYRKSVYLLEVNYFGWKGDNCLYQWGDWQTHVIDKQCDFTQYLFGGTKPIILPCICGDLNVPASNIRCRNDGTFGLCNEMDKQIMQQHSQQYLDKIEAAKLLLVSARDAPVMAQKDVSTSISGKMVIVDSRRKENSKHNFGGEFRDLVWNDIPAHKDNPGVVVHIGNNIKKDPKPTST